MSIKEKRKKLDLTQAALAPLLGISLKAIQSYEQGLRNPSKSVLMLLDKLLKH